MSERFDVLIVGAGHGGATAAASLRQFRFAGSVALLSQEAHLPYDRPPLSKDYLSGERSLERMWIRPGNYWAERNITLKLGQAVTAINARDKYVTLQDGARLEYASLVWAAGGRPRNLSCEGSSLKGVHTLRTLADADALKLELPAAKNVVIIGGGYIGLEAAAVFSKIAKKVTLLESLDRVLSRVTAEPVSRFYEAVHRSHGVDVRLRQEVACIEGVQGKTSAVRLRDGSRLPADIVIVGVGIIPSVEPLLDAGAQGDNGVAIDAHCATSLPDVYAVGDCAMHVNHYAGGRWVRVESVQNAHDQAQVVARSLSGIPSDYVAIPWFWSNQYDLKLQTVGLSMGYDTALVRGDPARRSFSLIYLRERQVIALDCINAPKDFVQGRLLVSAASCPPAAALTDNRVPLKDLC
jgi:3-phenylpropionate/trans-cinnamate dioxygenase ferredoxin reductase component